MALLRVPLVRVGLVWLALASLLAARSFQALADRRFPDPDDVLRLVQVRDLLAGQGWFDLHQYRIDGPAGTLMHWSRIVDVPLALVIGALSPLVGSAAAEQVAIVAVPLLTLAVTLLAVAKTAGRVMDLQGVTLACLCIGLSPMVLAQVQPLRIDHHGWQIFTVVLAMAGMIPGRRTWGPALSGAALAVGLSISLEILPITAAFGAAFALRWLADGVTHRPLAAFLGSLAAGLALLFLTTRGLSDLAQHCDVISPAHLGLFAIAAFGVAVGASLRGLSRPAIVGVLGLSAAAGLAFYVWTAPQCLAGPFGNLDPLVREFWYENVAEGRPAWRIAPELWIPIAVQGLIALATLAWLWRHRTGEARRWWFEYLLISGIAFVTGLLVWRSLAFVGALSAIPLGWLAGRLLQALRESERPLRKVAVAVVMVLVLVPSFPVAVAQIVVPKNDGEPGEAGPGTSAACRLAGSAAALNRLPPAKVFAPLDLGPALLDRSRHGVVATAHHRANLSMHDVIAAFLGSTDTARALVRRHHAEYVMLCTEMGEVGLYRAKAPDGFAARLVAGRIPDWLKPVPLEGPSEGRLWRVERPKPAD